MGAITEDKTLSEQEKNLLRALRREWSDLASELEGGITATIVLEIEKLRSENKQLHEQAMHDMESEYKIKLARQERFMIRLAHSILALFGKEDN